MNATVASIVRAMHTLTSHSLHNIHNQGIFIVFLVLPLQLLICKTSLPLVLLISILTVLDDRIDTISISYTDSLFFYKLDIAPKA